MTSGVKLSSAKFPRNYVHDYLVPNAFYVKTPKDEANILISFRKHNLFYSKSILSYILLT